MNSKEALCYLDDIAHGRKMEYDAHELKCIVEKDLEILDIFKKHYNSNYPILSISTFILFYICKDDKDFNKIKEWLENDSNKNKSGNS